MLKKIEAAKIESPWRAFYTINKNTGASQADRLRGLLPPELKSRPRVHFTCHVELILDLLKIWSALPMYFFPLSHLDWSLGFFVLL